MACTVKMIITWEGGNPFRDAGPEAFAQFRQVASQFLQEGKISNDFGMISLTQGYRMVRDETAGQEYIDQANIILEPYGIKCVPTFENV